MNPREIDVMSILFNSVEPLTVSDITASRRDLTQSTVTSVIRKLLNRNYVEVTGTTYSGKVLSRLYRPSEKGKEAMMEFILQLYGHINKVVTTEEMCRAIKDRYPKRRRG